MADVKKYYYLKLKENFFESDEAVVLESLPDGYIYSNILLKLYLRSLKSNGLLMFNGLVPYNSQMLASITRHQVGTVEKAIDIFKQLGLIEILDNGAIYMTNIQNFVGKSSTEADRKRIEREKIKELTLIGTNVGQMSEKNPPEIEIELEKELKIEKEIDKDNIYSPVSTETKDTIPYQEIISYLNEKAKTNYRASGKKTQSLIKARWKEGFKLDDFKTVIDKKTNQWLHDAKMVEYLRPETLFGTKFESYLNQPDSKNTDYYTKRAGQRFSQAELDELAKPNPEYGF